jgi:hypothetical protein
VEESLCNAWGSKKKAVHPSQEALWIAGRKPDVFYVRKTVAWRQWSMMAE